MTIIRTLLIVLLCAATRTCAANTYTWNANSGNLTAASNWSPIRSSPQSSDILIFNTTCSANINSASFAAGQIKIQNGATVTWIVTNNASGGQDVNIGAGISGDDFAIDANCTLILEEATGNNFARINVLANNTAFINGRLLFNGGSNGESKLLSPTSQAITVGSTGSIEVASGLKGSVFYNGTQNTAGVVVFNSGSQYIHNSAAALNPFGMSSGSKVVFNSGSAFVIRNGTNTVNPSINGDAYKGTFDVTGRTYANIIVESSVSIRFQNADFTFDDLTIKTGVSFSVVCFDQFNAVPSFASKILIKGNITGEGTGSLLLQTGQGASNSRIVFSGMSQTISGGTGNFYFDPRTFSYLDILSGTTLTLNRNIFFGDQSSSSDRYFRVNAGATLVLNANCVTARGSAYLFNSGYIKTTNANAFYRNATTSGVSFSGFGGYQDNQPGFTGSGTVEYNRNGDQEVTIFGNGYHNLVLSGGGTKTANLISNAYITFTGTASVAAGVIYNHQAYSFDYSAATLNVSGTFKTTNLVGLTKSDISGNWQSAVRAINLANLNFAAGSVIEYGASTGTQRITPLSTYKGLKISGGSQKEIFPFDGGALIACVVSENLILENGIVNITPNFSTIPTLTLETNAIVTGGSNSSYINNRMFIKTNKASSFVFPVGKSTGSSPYTAYRPINFTTTETTATTFQGEYFSQANPSISDPVLGNVIAVFNREYWQLNRTSGSAKAIVTLSYINPNAAASWTPSLDPATGNSYVLVVKNTSGFWEPSSLDPSSFTSSEWRLWNSNGDISTKEVSGLNFFSFGFLYNIVLPVKLLSLKGQLYGNNNLLQWQVSGGEAFALFEPEHSTNGSSFTKIASIKANAAGGNYSFTHTRLAGTNHYYRIKMFYKNGSWEYSKTILLSTGLNNALNITIHSTGAANAAMVLVEALNAQTIQMQVADMAGRLLTQQQYLLNTGKNQLRLSTGSMPKGNYLLKILASDGKVTSVKFFKE